MKKSLSLFMSALFAVLMMTLCTPVAFGANYSGSCGDSVSWELDTVSGEMVISGSGDMADYKATLAGVLESHDARDTTIEVEEEVFDVTFKVWSTLKRTVGLFFLPEEGEVWELVTCNLGDVIEGRFEVCGTYAIVVGW